MGVEDGRHGEQDRAEMSRGMGPDDKEGRSGRPFGRKPKDGIVEDIDGPDSKSGGDSISLTKRPMSTTTARNEHGDNPPNTVPMPITARGRSAAGDYRSTGLGGPKEEGYEATMLNRDGVSGPRRGGLANNPQASYNHATERQPARGEILGRYEDSNFYNDISEGAQHDPEADSGSGPGEYGKKINGFGAGRNTFGAKSTFYNEVGDEDGGFSMGDNEDRSGSGLVHGDRERGIKEVRGFNEGDGFLKAMI
jgi:hypothetical protein